MRARVLRSWKCRTGLHHGSPPRTVDIVDDETGETYPRTDPPCRWHRCRCYCHPWFVKRPTLRGFDHAAD